MNGSALESFIAWCIMLGWFYMMFEALGRL